MSLARSARSSTSDPNSTTLPAPASTSAAAARRASKRAETLVSVGATAGTIPTLLPISGALSRAVRPTTRRTPLPRALARGGLSIPQPRTHAYRAPLPAASVIGSGGRPRRCCTQPRSRRRATIPDSGRGEH